MAAQMLVGTAGAAIAVYLINKSGWSYDGITNPSEIKLIDIVAGAVVAAALSYGIYGAGVFDSNDMILSLIEGGAGVAFYRVFALSSSM
ncbi:MAG: hypothetical protein JSR46_03460 [Verrucomicrobia bacterium]|nr:hypothetical protein [Verrucomicrobiota bacterium]